MNVPEGTYTISPAHAPDLFLEASGGAPRNNGNIQVGTRNRADGRQEWTLYYAGDGYYYVSHEGHTDRGSDTTVRMYRWTGVPPLGFEAVE